MGVNSLMLLFPEICSDHVNWKSRDCDADTVDSRSISKFVDVLARVHDSGVSRRGVRVLYRHEVDASRGFPASELERLLEDAIICHKGLEEVKRKAAGELE